MGERQTRIVRLTFFAKVKFLQLQRWIRDCQSPVPRWTQMRESSEGERIEVRSRLFVDSRPDERAFELGKITNLRQAVASLDGVELPSGAVFSFWRQLGRVTSQRGFVQGRMLQLGCVVPSIGGGLCQLSNALYELALRSGCEILERHAHSHRMPGAPPIDATVAWNYIDLRFRARTRTRIELSVTDSELIAAFVCTSLPHPPVSIGLPMWVSGAGQQAELPTCATCLEVGCSRHESTPRAARGKLGDEA